jgi:UDP-glucose 4-epimerase
MRTLITGGAGFIGSHLADALLKDGHQVSVVDDLSTGNLANIQHLSGESRFRFVRDTVTNESTLAPLVADCDVVFHLAAAVGVKQIIEKTVDSIKTNILGAEVVLRLADIYHKKVLIASSSEVYGKSSIFPFQEEHDMLLGPTVKLRWSYAATKAVDEFLALAYYRQNGLPIVIVRFFNTIGPRQSGQYGMVVPRFVEQALSDQPLTVFDDGQQSRCFLDVEDAVRAVIQLAVHPAAVGQVINVGSDVEVTILDLANSVLTMIRDGARDGLTQANVEPDQRGVMFVPYEEALGSDFEEPRRRVPDISRLRALTNWEPKYNLTDTIQKIIDWYQVRPK